jgi:hypothetical protein
MPIRPFLTALIAIGTISACASAPAANPAAHTDTDHANAVLASARRWTGSFAPTQSLNASVMPSSRQKGNGTVELTVAPNNPDLTHVRLTVAVAREQGLDNLGWAILGGDCGSGDPPVLAPGVFPLMALSPNGQAKFDDNIPFTLPESGNYHVNIFRGSGNQLSDVITCAVLRRKT